MSDNSSSTPISRREVLKAGGALAAAAALYSLLEQPQPAQAGDTPAPALRDPQRPAARVIPPPPLPPLDVLALNRLTFGIRPGDRSAFTALGATPQEALAAFVEQQLDPTAIDDSDCDARLAAANFISSDKTLLQLWADHVVNAPDWNYRILPAKETRQAAWLRAVYSKRQLFELVVDFWHNHFNVHGDHSVVAPTFVQYDRDVIRKHALGNFRALLEDVAKSTSMLYYLDNYISSVSGFNENYARELLELHTLGAENYLGVLDPLTVPRDANGWPIGYVDNDVYEAARAFTGWRVNDNNWQSGVVNTGTFLYYSTWHDRANKLFLGKYLPADQADLKDGRDVLTRLADHPGTARFIARKLCRRFIADNPPEELVQRVADVFYANRAAGDQLKQTLRAVLLSDEFRNTWGEKIRRPFEFAAGLLRSAKAEFFPSDEFFWTYESLGQPLYGRIPPDGFPDIKEAWNGSYMILQRFRLANAIVSNNLDNISLNLLAQMPADRRSPESIVLYWVSRLLNRSMHPASNRTELIEFIAQGRNPTYDLTDEMIAERLPLLVGLIFMSPDFQLR